MDSSPADAVLDVAQLRNITLNDAALMREIVTALLSDVSAKINALEKAITAGRTAECVQLAHSAAGACGNVGALSLAALFRAVEGLAGKGRLSECRDVLASLKDGLEQFRAAAANLA